MPPNLSIKLLIFSLLIFSISLVNGQSTSSCEAVLTNDEIEIEGEPVSFYWLDSKSQRGLLLTTRGNVYLTQNTGQSWDKLSFGSDDPLIREVTQTSDIATVYVVSDDKFWVTKDAAKTWSQKRLSGGNSWDFYPHPSNPSWIAGVWWSTWVPCQIALSRIDCYRGLSVSYDYGDSWVTAQTYVQEWQWSSGEELLYSSWEKKSGNQYYKNQEELTLYASNYTSGAFQNRIIFTPGVVGFSYQYLTQSLFIAKKTLDETTLTLFSSLDLGHTINSVYFGEQEIEQNRYTIYESSEGDSIFIVLESTSSDDYGHLYHGDEKLEYFTLVLPYVIKRDRHQPDLYEFAGLPGVYLVNSYNLTEEGKTVIESGISYNSGGSWYYLPPPAPFEIGSGRCVPPCALHLDMESDALPKSLSSAPGLMLAVGNIGTSLNSGVNEGLFFTREAGSEWERVRTTRWDLYELGDYGNLLISAQSGKNDLGFSWDQGESWVDCVIGTDLMIQDIYPIPNNPLLFLIFLRSSVLDFSPEYGLVWLDFSQLNERECVGSASPNTRLSDYETWVPPLNSNQCILGQKETFVRRKKEANCYVPSGDEVLKVETCECTFEDYECDYCYTKQPETDVCFYYCQEPFDLEEVCGDDQESYNQTQGYRKIANTVCHGVTEYDPILTPCPAVITTTGTTGTSGSTGTPGTTSQPATTGAQSSATTQPGTTSSQSGDSNSNKSADEDDDDDILPVVILGGIVGLATLVGVILLIVWLIQAKNKPVPEELRDVGEMNRLYDRT